MSHTPAVFAFFISIFRRKKYIFGMPRFYRNCGYKFQAYIIIYPLKKAVSEYASQ
jgi:hypothetical protein